LAIFNDDWILIKDFILTFLIFIVISAWCLFRHKSRSKRSGSGKTAQSSGHESMGSHDTGIYLNTNSTESSGMHQRQPAIEVLSADVVSPVCEPSTPIAADASDTEKPHHGIKSHTSFEKTSTWLLQQDSSRTVTIKEAVVGLERATQSNISVGCKSSDVNIASTVIASHSEPVLLQNVVPSDNDISMARSSVTIIAPASSEQALSCVLAPSCQNSSRQKTRQLRFSCAVPAMEDCRDSKDSSIVDTHTSPSKMAINGTEETDGEHWVTYSTRNDIEELSMEDGVSVANSNTSLSDTCNSSFKSSTEDLANHVVSCTNENSTLAACNAAEVTPRMSTLRSHPSPGLRHRKRSQRLHTLSPARLCEHVRLAEEREENFGGSKICHECDTLIVDAGGGLRQSVDTATAVVGELPRAAVSSDDDDNDDQPVPRISPSKSRLMHARHSRRPCSARTMRSSEKFQCHNAAAETSPKDWGARVEGRRSNVRIMDVRLLESTGISSADSDAEAAKQSATKSASPSKASNIVDYFLPGKF